MSEKIAERDHATIYYLGDCPFLPHYLEANTFVAPGGHCVAEHVLLEKGARRATGFLWPRLWQQKAEPKPIVARTFNSSKRSAYDQVLKVLSAEGCPMCVAELRKEVDASVSAIRDAVHKLHETGIIKPWGSRANINLPQRWIVV